jgi:hypothetical protein
MTIEAFIKVLDEWGYPYEIQGDNVVVYGKYTTNLDSLTSLPPGVKFKSETDVWLESLTSLPTGISFENEGNVYLRDLTSISPMFTFGNKRDVHLGSLTGGWFSEWNGNIKGIESKWLLNKMIKDGVFER